MAKFIDEGGYSADQVRACYMHLLSPADFPTDPKDSSLLREMKQLTDAGFPVTRLSYLVTSRERYEDAPREYVRYVNTLPLTEKERRVLESIVAKRRSGELVFSVDGRGSLTVHIEFPKQPNAEFEALLLLDKLRDTVKRIGNSKFELSFVEL